MLQAQNADSSSRGSREEGCPAPPVRPARRLLFSIFATCALVHSVSAFRSLHEVIPLLLFVAVPPPIPPLPLPLLLLLLPLVLLVLPMLVAQSQAPQSQRQ